ncbi:MAG: DMT family protein [Silvanigrellales bacterium]|nr:DMT family protein [Silvanigrellales bacterium]
MNPALLAALLLLGSSCFMVVAWYAHLKFTHLPLWQVILGSWAIAFFEYCLQVPGNRIGHQVFSAAQLRIIAELFTLAAFIIFSLFVLKEPMNGNYAVAFGLVVVAVWFAVAGPFR